MYISISIPVFKVTILLVYINLFEFDCETSNFLLM